VSPVAAVRKTSGSDGALYIAVALGSAIGGTARWLVSEWMQAWAVGGFPWGTLFVNVTGSFLIGFYAALTAPDGRLLASPRQRHFVIAGICGGYTTFSIFSLEALRMALAGNIALSGLHLSISLAAWLLAVWVGYALATRMNRLRRT
jgi:fluoride exporter